MARPLRIEYSNAWYHVMNRGLRREDIFFNRDDRISFLSLLKDIFENYHVQIHAYCLMNNHYHLMLNTPFPNLSKAMRHLNGLYTQRFNRSHNTDGPLFRGRYKSKIIQSEEYLTSLSRYIHLNPVAAKIVQSPEDFEWSSYRSFARLSEQPKWLFCDETLSYFGTQGDQARIASFRNYVNEGIDDETQKLLSSNKGPAILGSKTFIQTMAQRLKTHVPFEIPEQKPLIRLLQPSLSTIKRVVQDYFEINEDEFAISGQKIGNKPRQIAIYLAGKHTCYSHQLIANFFARTSRYGVARSCHLIKLQVETDMEIAKIISAIERKLFGLN